MIMRKFSGIFFLILFISASVFGQQTQTKKTPSETKAQKEQRMKWWKDARFGLFIHWGIYSVPAGVWKSDTNHAEWIRNTAKIPIHEYEKFVQQFDPVKFNAEAWVKLAKAAGMKYIVITSKHHDGFCMFDTKQTDFDIMSTPFHRDVMKELAAACKKEGIQLCFYYSIMDWHHPDYLPRRTWETDRSTDGANMENYITYMKKELKELLTNYGKIGVLWFDGEWENTWTHERGRELYQYVRSLQPDIIINNRVDVGREGMEGLTKEGGFVGDFGTPEQEIPNTGIPGKDWESCMTMNNNWGYNSHDNHWKSPEDLVRKLIDIASKGGNFLLNVGPTAEGVFPQPAIDRLEDIGSWMSKNSESIYATQASPFKLLSWGRCTQKSINGGTRLYLHIFDWPADGKIRVPGLGSEVIGCYSLADNVKLNAVRSENDYIINVSNFKQQQYATVIALDIKGKPIVYEAPEIKSSSDIFLSDMPVEISTKIPGAVIRYTINGDEPGMKSWVVRNKIILNQSATIKAKCFLNGKPITETAVYHVEKVVPAASIDIPSASKGINYSIYEGKWNQLPDFSSLQTVESGSLDKIDISKKRGKDEYGYVFDGLIKIPKDGIYTFYISSDDGSKLLIDNKELIDNDGLHGMGEKSKETPLAKGYHKFKVLFFENSGEDDLQVFWKGPGFEKAMIPASVLFKE